MTNNLSEFKKKIENVAKSEAERKRESHRIAVIIERDSNYLI